MATNRSQISPETLPGRTRLKLHEAATGDSGMESARQVFTHDLINWILWVLAPIHLHLRSYTMAVVSLKSGSVCIEEDTDASGPIRHDRPAV
jgi:hypothetical protein